MTQKVENLIEQGIHLYKKGDAKSALRCFELASREKAEDAEIISLAGLALTSLGRFEEAHAKLAAAVEKEPHQPGFWLNLAEFYIKKAALSEAESTLVSLLSRFPLFKPARHRLAQLYMDAARYEDTEKLLTKVPTKELGPALFKLLVTSLQYQGKWLSLAKAASDWTNLFPTDLSAWLVLAGAQHECGNFELARQSFQKILNLEPENPSFQNMYGQACLNVSEYQEAAKALDKAESLQPNNPSTLTNQGLLHTFLGNLDLALDYSIRSQRLAPDHLPVYSQLSRLRKGQLQDTEIESLQRIAGTVTSEEERSQVHFLLAHHYHARQEFDKAMQEYELANQHKSTANLQRGVHYSQQETESKFDRLRHLAETVSVNSDSTEKACQPIFVVGMPRSGTSLLDSLLARHPDVTSLGERVEIPALITKLLAEQPMPADILEQIRRDYCNPQRVRDRLFVDKNPANIEAVGVMAKLFPAAAFVQIERHPIETCLSIYRYEFSHYWTFATSLRDVAHYYGQYRRLMEHWQLALGKRLLTIQYESLASDPSLWMKKIYDHCGLDWNDAYLEGKGNIQPVATLSTVQVRGTIAVARHRDKYLSLAQQLSANLRANAVDCEQ
ncbi:tetratricopeptide repeat-containing sulfotransferase family protein [Bowmanella dokdonensis]|uniref:Sulfotransferase n=1 Tax=Bowmanella dokdonensis TaxID=751969 RepID=A0A939DMM1_9ALTE|nr:tetratricopeptide repeat-containing sulfotransferase family protein [Bowmanella dokdonensis]MBN7824905.1 sulfotransferase [Bowmanella dokdonensis]